MTAELNSLALRGASLHISTNIEQSSHLAICNLQGASPFDPRVWSKPKSIEIEFSEIGDESSSLNRKAILHKACEQLIRQ